MWLKHCPWILKTALSVNGASDSRKGEDTSSRISAEKRVMMSGHDDELEEQLWPCALNWFRWTEHTRGHKGTGWMDTERDGIDGITTTMLVSDRRKCRMAMWGGSLGYHLHEVNMHDVHISKYAHMCLWKREKRKKGKCVGGKEKSLGYMGGAQWRRGPDGPQPPPSITSLRYTWHSAELCASLLQLLNKGCQRGEEKQALSTQNTVCWSKITILIIFRVYKVISPPIISSLTFCSSFRTSSRISCRIWIDKQTVSHGDTVNT